MSRRILPLAPGLAAFALCALAACKPATPPSADAPSAVATATPAGNDSTPASAPSAIAAAAAVLNPLASPKDEITASMEKFLAVRSYHASMQVSGGPRGTITNEVDFVAPDRYRMQLPMGTQYIVGDTMYMDMQGKVMKVPMPKGTLSQWRDPVRLAENTATMTVEAQGSEVIGGSPARKYLVHNTQPQPSDVTMWIGGNGLPVQIRASSTTQGQTAETTIRYSRFNDPTLRVDPPQ
jgi:hypothetical protein